VRYWGDATVYWIAPEALDQRGPWFISHFRQNLPLGSELSLPQVRTEAFLVTGSHKMGQTFYCGGLLIVKRERRLKRKCTQYRFSLITNRFSPWGEELHDMRVKRVDSNFYKKNYKMMQSVGTDTHLILWLNFDLPKELQRVGGFLSTQKASQSLVQWTDHGVPCVRG